MLIKLCFIYFVCVFINSCGSDTGGSASGPLGNQSVAGSTATFLTYKNTLFALDRGILKVFDISLPTPRLENEINVFGAQTLHIYEDYLYMGGVIGVDIFDISIPQVPLNVGFYSHVRSCDPIVVEDDIGYVTLRTAGDCGRISRDSLDILDVSDPSKPTLLKSFPMSSPWGLAKTPDFLAVCQEGIGLALVDVVDIDDISLISRHSAIKCFDLIYYDERLVTTADNGIGQYAIEGETLTPLSIIPIKNFRAR